MNDMTDVWSLGGQISPELISLDPEAVGGIAAAEEVDEFEEEVEEVPYYKLPRQEKLQRAGIHEPGWPSGEKKRDGDEEMEVGYSASDSSASEYEAEVFEGGTGEKKKKKSALKLYQKKTGRRNVMDPTVVREFEPFLYNWFD